ncbi:hypothetical protein F0562_028529 [Nyssa sinensis]|uniref:Transposase MuDR plant domain-containing protein n=1 Tax=Nyssa sinensis TaxID=561372 RepID=A0A5J5B4I3_9ASTE|nr:hypothetical protein F0562_028529 [Nyssa sinensis]
MVNIISNVDPDKYSYIKLLQDVGELSLSHVSVVIGFAINLHCDIPDSNDRMIVSSDLDVSKIPVSDSDDVYGLTSEDETFVPSVGENLRNSTFNTVASPSVNVEVHGGDDLSDFESNDDAEYNPSSDDSSTDEGEGKGKGKSTSRVFEYHLYEEEYHARDGDKIVLKSRQLFKNVDKFREVMKDYTIQQGCSIIRDKNEKAKVDAMQTYLQKTYGIKAMSLSERCLTMAGQKVNAKGKQVGSLLNTLKDENVFLLARCLKYSKYFAPPQN